MHVGWQVAPEAKLVAQSAAPPLVGELLASQESAWHVAGVSVPALHDDVPMAVYPLLHVGWQVAPEAKLVVQSPHRHWLEDCWRRKGQPGMSQA
jgi:hypothetical protein